MLKKLISGGQTGADQAALDFAIENQILHGGWIPKGRMTEEGPLPHKYNLQEMPTKSYPKRTEKNILDSDGTLIVSHGTISGGTALTRKLAKEHLKPWLHINLDEVSLIEASTQLQKWVEQNNIQVLNVAGARASKDEKIYSTVQKLLKIFIKKSLNQSSIFSEKIAKTTGVVMKSQGIEKNNEKAGQILHFLCPENGTFPNNNSLELCILKQVFSPATVNLVQSIEQCFQKNGWPPAWRNGLYDMHHYHSTAHEALGVYSGWVEACFGGPGGIIQTASAGDVIIIPAGVSHKNIKQSADFRVVGAYPEGQPLNMKYGRPGERPQVDQEIQQVALPQTDPVHGTDGPLMKIWLK